MGLEVDSLEAAAAGCRLQLVNQALAKTMSPIRREQGYPGNLAFTWTQRDDTTGTDSDIAI